MRFGFKSEELGLPLTRKQYDMRFCSTLLKVKAGVGAGYFSGIDLAGFLLASRLQSVLWDRVFS
jgi:hypothetical protein